MQSPDCLRVSASVINCEEISWHTNHLKVSELVCVCVMVKMRVQCVCCLGLTLGYDVF